MSIVRSVRLVTQAYNVEALGAEGDKSATERRQHGVGNLLKRGSALSPILSDRWLTLLIEKPYSNTCTLQLSDADSILVRQNCHPNKAYL